MKTPIQLVSYIFSYSLQRAHTDEILVNTSLEKKKLGNTDRSSISECHSGLTSLGDFHFPVGCTDN